MSEKCLLALCSTVTILCADGRSRSMFSNLGHAINDLEKATNRERMRVIGLERQLRRRIADFFLCLKSCTEVSEVVYIA